jgi:hypothetical protein
LVEPYNLQARVLAAEHRHKSVTREFGLGSFLVVGNALGACAVRFNDRDVKCRLILNGHIGMREGAREERDAGHWPEAFVHSD